MTSVAPVKQQEQTIFMYRLRIYTAIHACVEIATIAVGIRMVLFPGVPSDLFIWAVVPPAIALAVTANFTGQFCCSPRSNYTRTGAVLNALLLVISAVMSVYLVFVYTVVTGWCNAADGIYKADHKDFCDSVSMGALFGWIGMVMKIITFLLMFPFCCCGWKGLKPMPGSAGYV